MSNYLLNTQPNAPYTIAVVIPCYRTRAHILAVLHAIGPECSKIVVVDDNCPEQTGQYVQENSTDPRVSVVFHEFNQGVGGAVITGYRRALADGATIIVKIDGDGQMDPALISNFVMPILEGSADYTKGNRFFDLSTFQGMPKIRIFGNSLLSFLTKISSGYWQLFDPTNGYTAIHAAIIGHLPLEKISKRYFFESDMLFRLNTIRAVVADIPMTAKYGDETSNLRVSRVIFEFAGKNLANTYKRIFYNYFLRSFSVASIELVLGVGLFAFGVIFGLIKWWQSSISGHEATAGTAVLASLSVIVGLQFMLAFLSYDIASVPSRTIHRFLERRATPTNQRIAGSD